MHKGLHKILILLFLFSTSALLAQDSRKTLTQNPFAEYKEKPVYISQGTGLMYYWGDLAEGFSPEFARPSANFAISYYFKPQIAVRIGVLTGTIYANDKGSEYETHVARNLHFRSNITEFSSILVYEIFKNQKLASRYLYKIGKIVSPYVFCGTALFHFNPKGKLDGRWIALQPLGTEGQFITSAYGVEAEVYDKPSSYKRWALAIPFGGGIKFNYSDRLPLASRRGSARPSRITSTT